MAQLTLDGSDLLAPVRSSLMAGAATRPAPGRLWSLLRRAENPPARSPWGEVVETASLAPGLDWFRTAARCGYRLSPRRQKALPHYLRSPDGWYGDVVEWAGVAVVFARVFERRPAADRAGSLYDLACDTLRDWRPEAYEAWFQTTLDAEEVWSCAVMRFHRDHRDDWIVCDPPRGALAVDARGRAILRAKLGGDPPYGASLGLRRGPTRRFAAPLDDVHAGRGAPLLIDPRRHEALPDDEDDGGPQPFLPSRGWDGAAGLRLDGA